MSGVLKNFLFIYIILMDYKYFYYKDYLKKYTNLKKEDIYDHYLNNKKNNKLIIKKSYLKNYIENIFPCTKLSFVISDSYYIKVIYKIIVYTGVLEVNKIDNLINKQLSNFNKYLIKRMNLKEELIILIPVWKRHEILQYCMNKLKKMNLQKNIIYIVSNREDLNIVKKNGFNFCLSVNKPLGFKFNTMIKLVKNLDCKYFMILGSDDFIEKDYISKSLNLIDKYDVIGTNTQIIHIKKDIYKRSYNGHYNRTFGSGRIYTKEMAEKLNYDFFDENINHSLDRSITIRMDRNNLKMGIVDSSIISYFCEDNHITHLRYMFQKDNKMELIK